MKINNTLVISLSAIITLILVATIFYQLGKTDMSNNEDELRQEVERLRSSEEDAAVVKRVSQQMENIAYQQKDISDRQRERAEIQSQLAVQMRNKAEQERQLAQQTENQARASAHQAEISAKEADMQRANAISMQRDAEEQRDAATRAKSKSDTLSYRTLGKTLGASSLTTYANKKYELASLLAYAGYYFIDKYKGNIYQPDVFEALIQSSGTKKQKKIQQGGGIIAFCKAPDGDVLAISDYGEIEYCGKQKVVFYDKQYKFCDAHIVGNDIFALTVNGQICQIPLITGTLKKGQNCIVYNVPNRKYFKIIPVNESTLLLAGKSGLCWFQIKAKRSTPISINKSLSTIMMVKDGFGLFFTDGCYGVMDTSGRIKLKNGSTAQVVTATYEDKLHKRLYLGCENGEILMYNTQNGTYMTTLYGHTGKITSVLSLGEMLVSSSYDKTVAVWNLNKLQQISGNAEFNDWLIPASISYQGWPLRLCQADNSDVYIGTSRGNIQRINISAPQMANTIKQRMKRNLTKDEWNQYVNSSVPYVKFIKEKL